MQQPLWGPQPKKIKRFLRVRINSTVQANTWINSYISDMIVQSKTLASKSSMVILVKFIEGKIIKQNKSWKQELSALYKIHGSVASISHFS